MKTIRMTVKGGVCHIETEGFKGDGCIKATEDLKRRLGEEVGDRELSDEFYQEVTEEQLETERF